MIIQLSKRYLNDFLNQTREKGRSYYLQERVKLRQAGRNALNYTVFGSKIYQVSIKRTSKLDSSHISFDCSCPEFQKGENCKHIWSTLIDADERALWDEESQETTSLGTATGSEEEAEIDASKWQENFENLKNTVLDFEIQVRNQGQLRSYERTSFYSLKYRETQKKNDFVIQPRHVALKPDLDLSSLTREDLIKYSQSTELKIEHISLYPRVDDQSLLLTFLANQSSEEFHLGDSKVTIPPSVFHSTLVTLVESKRFFLELGTDSQYWIDRYDQKVWHPSIELTHLKDDQYLVQCFLSNDDKSKKVAVEDIEILSDQGAFVYDHVLCFFEPQIYDWLFFFRSEKFVVPEADLEGFFENISELPRLPDLNWPDQLSWKKEAVEVSPILVVGEPDPGKKSLGLSAQIDFDYEGIRIPSSNSHSVFVDKPKKRIVSRDNVQEELFLAAAKEVGLYEARESASNDFPYRLRKDQFIEATRKLMGQKWRVESFGKRMSQFAGFSLNVKTGVDWFDLTGGVKFGNGESVPLPLLLKAAKEKAEYIELGDGTLGMLPEKWLSQFSPLLSSGKKTEEGMRYNRIQGALLSTWIENEPSVIADRDFKNFHKQLQSARFDKEIELSPEFIGELRTYQNEGLSWLKYLENLRFGGILADDMGLGKTVQILAHLQCRKITLKDHAPHLIIVPRSLIFNWLEEAEKFTPDLKVVNFSGPDRKSIKTSDLKKHDIVLITYQILRMDVEELSKIEFDHIVIDEAQAIKNPSAKISRACRTLQGRSRLALTGTPVENSAQDLFSIMDFVNPGLISKNVRDQFTTLSQEGQSVGLLTSAIRPFLLRRTKSEVLKDLPEKTENVMYCELSDTERAEYDKLKNYYQSLLTEKIDNVGLAKSKIEILEALLRLRQASCHPGLIDPLKTEEPSTKLDVLIEQITELSKEGHKALVFSQFTSFLKIVKARFEKENIKHLYLDGKTRKRAELVHEFQNNDENAVFLISLKAGGVGLNLTSADYVFVLDPWWNPAAESQAIDRAHRIGQERHVFAYKMIAKDTVEEKILKLQKTKKGLADSLINNNTNMLKKIDYDDLQYLLS